MQTDKFLNYQLHKLQTSIIKNTYSSSFSGAIRCANRPPISRSRAKTLPSWGHQACSRSSWPSCPIPLQRSRKSASSSPVRCQGTATVRRSRRQARTRAHRTATDSLLKIAVQSWILRRHKWSWILLHLVKWQSLRPKSVALQPHQRETSPEPRGSLSDFHHPLHRTITVRLKWILSASKIYKQFRGFYIYPFYIYI